VTVYLGRVDGTFLQQPSYHLPGVGLPMLEPLLLGDFNGDGNLDIAYRTLATQFYALIEPRFQVLQGNGDGTFTIEGHIYQFQSMSRPFVGGDFNGDHLDDLVEMIGYTSSFHTIEGGPAPVLEIALDSHPILGTKGSATVTLSHPATGTETVTLAASDPAIQIPTTLTFSSAQQVRSFAFTLGSGYDATHIVALYATLGTQTAVGYGYRPNPNQATGVGAYLLQGIYPLFENTNAITPGESFPLTLRLESVGEYAGNSSSLQCLGLPANSSCSFADSSVEILTDRISEVNFTVSTSANTPQGTYPVQITTTDGFFVASVTLTLGIGDFALSVNPALVVLGPAGSVNTMVTSTSTHGLNEGITLTCAGLPAGALCSQTYTLGANGETGALSLGGSGLMANDYPFQITGRTNLTSHTIPATLRVEDYSLALDNAAATLSAGQSATFSLTLKSVVAVEKLFSSRNHAKICS